MTIYNPIKRSQTRSMNRGDSKVEKFNDEPPEGVDPSHHSTLLKHGYKHVSTSENGAHNTYQHSSGATASHYGGSTILHASPRGMRTSTIHRSANDLHKALGGDAKLSVSAGAAMDPAVKGRKDKA